MKQKILNAEFNDKNFWSMFDPNDALEYFIPGYRQYQPDVTFTIQDTNLHDKYMRHIEIWAEGTELSLFIMHLRGFNK